MPWRACSTAMPFIIEISAPFDAAVVLPALLAVQRRARRGEHHRPALRRSCATICFTASCAVKNAPSRLTRITRCHSSSLMPTKLGAWPPTPALTKHESMRPSAATVAAMLSMTA